MSFTSGLLRTSLRLLLKPALSPRWSVPAQRRWLERLSAMAILPKHVQRADTVLATRLAECWRDACAPACRAGNILYLHGGGFCVGSPRTHRALAAWLARDTGLPVHVLDYRLAPEHPFPAALDDALAAYDELITQGPVLLAGDSAGGGLALSLALRLRDRGGAQPTAIALLSPWVDLRGEHVPAPVPGEAVLTEAWAKACAQHYAGDALGNLQVSPLLADLRGLPPILVQWGSDELLREQAQALVAALKSAEVQTQFEEWSRCWHVHALHAGQWGRANAAVAQIAQFLLRGLDAASPARHQHHEVVILGAGMSGLCTAIQLHAAGLHDFLVLEQSQGLGGTWWDNRYPGAQVDVPAPAYAFSFAPNARWKQRFANALEIHAYQQRLAEKHGLFARLRLGTRLSEARFDEAQGLWHFRTGDGGTLSSRFFVCSTGPLSQPSWPQIEGLDQFQGLKLHSARWNADASLQGLRVGVIGTGSTGVQLIPQIAAQAAQLHVFQRTANWVLPRLERKYRWFDRVLLKLPGYAATVRWCWANLLELVRRGFDDGSGMRRFMLWLAAHHRRQQVADPLLREELVPDYPLGCKRIIFASNYYPALAQANVELVTARIARITASGIRLGDGSERVLDALVCATGFETVHLLQSVAIQGRDGRLLADAWSQGPEAFHGISVAGFPNLFLMLGPNTATGHTSTLFYIEPAVQHAIGCMRAVREGSHRCIEVREDAMRAHNADLQQRLGHSVWSQCRSWYRMDGGKVVAIFPGFTREYVRAVRVPRMQDYRLDS